MEEVLSQMTTKQRHASGRVANALHMVGLRPRPLQFNQAIHLSDRYASFPLSSSLSSHSMDTGHWTQEVLSQMTTAQQHASGRVANARHKIKPRPL
ncbi:hypothetical protein Y032_0118g777 [Ancylostoma ceylanicum]|uniref:Uncharacterized protein n=1 Tax=Ancylostoma ceylanicum TaxID=53326 RepID=A0A016TBR0_9BILA|nr:hypothetical protein Y032_0118g777 [Ancylostoma ceylanicum]